MATNMYLKFEPELGEGSSAENHVKEVEVLSWGHGFSQPTSPTRSAAGAGTIEQATHGNLAVTKYLDAATSTIVKACWSGDHFKKATLTCYRADGDKENKALPYLTVEMESVVIADYRVSGGPGDLPVENLALDYGSVKYNYADQKQDGTPGGNDPTAHDLRTRKIS
jgi:type VI secretion system secreted protein Hcp